MRGEKIENELNDLLKLIQELKDILASDQKILEVIKNELTKYQYNEQQIEIVNATEDISCNEPPVLAIRRKKDSSIVVGMKLVKEGKADAFLSAGSTGAVLAGGQLLIGRIKGVEIGN